MSGHATAEGVDSTRDPEGTPQPASTYHAVDGGPLNGVVLGAVAAVIVANTAKIAGGRLDAAGSTTRHRRDLGSAGVVTSTRGWCHDGGAAVEGEHSCCSQDEPGHSFGHGQHCITSETAAWTSI